MKIAILGTRGIPACYGGFETFAEELSIRLVERGHEVTVYGRSNIIRYPEKVYKGVHLVILPTISHKYFDTVVHTFISFIHSLFKDFEIILLCNAANSMFSFIPRLTGKKVIINVDGIERMRAKWNALGKLWYRVGEVCACIFPNVAISDAKVIEEYYRKTYGKKTVFIPYGAQTERVLSTGTLDRFGLKPQDYFLYVSRLEPENNAHLVIKAFEKIKTDKNLVIVGDAPYSEEYIRQIKNTKDPRIIFTGFVFGEGYKEFQSHAYCYIHATSVGGTHPALIESMGFGNCVIVNGTPENREVVRDAAIIFDENSESSLQEKLEMVIDRHALVEEFRKKARRMIEENYTWEKVTGDYENLFRRCLDKRS
ncbi:MAG: glycosyl transferase family 1 [Syntrophus sp. (in: bacteria)]|nr:glycosyl transferase family 1 [Syntrophus sp. (in: bacteria)]